MKIFDIYTNLSKIFKLTSSSEPVLSEQEKEVIHRFAAGEKELREQALKIYYKNLPTMSDKPFVLELAFMSEVDNICPDLALKGHYRQIILEGEK